MNKTLSISLAGFSFTIEEYAYIKLNDYLSALRNSLDVSEVDEVMHDIEIRMVEIFKETLGRREVINYSDVERVITQIGKPEIIEEQEEAYFSDQTKTKKNQANHREQRQLFRDPSKQKIAGICAGLAHYTKMDISMMRLFWVGIAVLGLFTAAISTSLIVLIYIILWAVLPKAESASDFLKMQGKPLNFDTLKEESNKIVRFANDSSKKVGEIYNENKSYIHNTGSTFWNVLRYILGAVFALMSLFFILGIFAIFGIFGVSKTTGITTDLDFYFDTGMLWVLKALITIGTLIPALLLGLLSIKFLSPKTKIRNLGYVIGALFITLLGLSLFFGINMAKKDMTYKGNKEDTENIAINTISDSILIDVKKIEVPQNFRAYESTLFSDKKLVYEGDNPNIEITRKDGIKTPYLIVKKQAEGYNIPLKINVPVEIVGNKVLIPNFIQYPYNERDRDYSVSYELVVPTSMKVISLNEDKIDLEDSDFETNTIEIDSTDLGFSTDSIIVNGKKVSQNEAEKILNKNRKEKETDIKDFQFRIKNGTPEISIKTK